jgi:chaperonin GroES
LPAPRSEWLRHGGEAPRTKNSEPSAINGLPSTGSVLDTIGGGEQRSRRLCAIEHSATATIRRIIRVLATEAGARNLTCWIWSLKAMNVRPLHDRIIVHRLEEGEQQIGGIIIPDSAKEKPQQGTVIAAGDGRTQKDGRRAPLDVKAGDRILFGKYSGNEIKLDAAEYIIMREDDVLGVLDAAPLALSKAG